MQTKKLVYSWTLVILLLTQLLIVCHSELLIRPPVRPSTFRSPAELKEYLTKLNTYYDIVGRPRFGKRSMKHPEYQRKKSIDKISQRDLTDVLDINDDGRVSLSELGLGAALLLDEAYGKNAHRR